MNRTGEHSGAQNKGRQQSFRGQFLRHIQIPGNHLELFGTPIVVKSPKVNNHDPSKTQPAFSGEVDLQVISRELVYQGFYQVEVLNLRHRLFQGGWSPTLRRELVGRRDAVCVLPYDPQRDCLVLCEQFRVGAMGRDESPWMFELIAGLEEPGEDPEAVARREALEEAGLVLAQMEEIASYYPSPGGANERVTLFVAATDAPQSGGVFGLAEEGENIQTHVLSRASALELLQGGGINNAATLVALQWLSLHGESLRQRWLGLAATS